MMEEKACKQRNANQVQKSESGLLGAKGNMWE